MKFSVLIPTRNRLNLLRCAVETVRDQDYGDWEIIVSDNASEEDIRGYVDALGDSRIRYVRTREFLPVTDNWNNALEQCSGDYVVVLGDDDGLVNGFFRKVLRALEDHGSADLVYANAYLFAYPGVVPGSPEGGLCVGRPPAFKDAKRPYRLTRKEALDFVRHSMNFRSVIAFNMQYAVIRRDLVEKIRARGNFFQSPYPDYYAMNVLFLQAQQILMVPEPLVIVGISPKSFGYYYFNRRESEGAELLKNVSGPAEMERLRNVLLPGTDMNTCFLLAMVAVWNQYGREIGLRVNYSRYRFLQILHVHANYYLQGSLPRSALLELRRRMRPAEKLTSGLFLPLLFVFARAIPGRFMKDRINKFMRMVNRVPILDRPVAGGKLSTLLDAYERTR